VFLIFFEKYEQSPWILFLTFRREIKLRYTKTLPEYSQKLQGKSDGAGE
jgi:hypothetical protein